MTLKSFGTCTVHEHVFRFRQKWHNHVHAWKTSSSKGSLLRDPSKMVDCDQREFSESVTLHAEQVGPAQALSLNAILHPPAATVHTDATSSSTQDGQQEERRDPGRKRGQKGGMKLASSIWRRGVCGGRRGRGGAKWTGGRIRGRKDGEEEAPALSGAVSVSVCMSVLTQSKSICHQDCHCGTKREGSLPGRTHSEKWRETRQAQWGGVGLRRSAGEGSRNLFRPTCKLQIHPPKSGRSDSIPSSTPHVCWNNVFYNLGLLLFFFLSQIH